MITTNAAPVPSQMDGAGSAQQSGAIFLKVEGLTKQFPGTRALDCVNLTLHRGEIHALLGENGAGKSTLIRQICGASQPTSGRILVEGSEVALSSPQAAAALGIAVVHQHLNLVPQLSVCENLLLAETLPRHAGLFVNWQEAYRRASRLLKRVGLNIDPRVEVGSLRSDESAMVAIAKAIGTNAKLIILDEPTTALLPTEVSILFGHMRRLAAEGHAFLYVSHRLAEVFDIADRASVLRDGRNAGEWTRAQMSRRAIIDAIVGAKKSWNDEVPQFGLANGAIALRANKLSGGRVRELSCEVRAHEILGIAGLPGSGAEEAFDLLYGRRPMTGGALEIAGHEVTLRSPRDAKRAGLALVPKDRLTESLLPGASIRENISLPNLGKYLADPLIRFVRRSKERSATEEIARSLSVRTPSIEASINSLSGGNQQKAVLGRWLASGAKIFLLNSPTAAIDVGAKGEIYALIRRIAADGAAVIFTSTEVEEFARICHRVIVFREGYVAGELVGKDATEVNILHLATGDGNER
jgi:ABC-type sugar transport system ATPase subunit